jgi:DNA (cytosine-5)-methyltransferase 1
VDGIREWNEELRRTGNPWHSEWPGVPRVANNIPNRVDRLKALGNAVVPRVAEWIGRQILLCEDELA